MKYVLRAIPLLLFGAVGVVLIVFWLFGIPWRVGGAPQQPVDFWHTIHVQVVRMDCLFCHRGADQGAAATVPAVEQCMFCHSVITGSGQAGAEIAKVRAAWAQQQPIDWIRVHQMPDHVRFAHEPHVRAGYQCATCHGDVGSMQTVTQVRSLRMGDCVSCHKANNGPTDCFKCHY